MAFGQSIRFAKAFVEVGLDATEAQKSLRQFRNQFRSMRRIGIGVGAGITAAMTPMVAILTKATQEAARFEETINRFNQEFGKLAPRMRQFTEGMVRDLGQSRQQITEMMAGFNTMLRRGGPENAARLSQRMTQLVVDLGSFFNKETVDVQRDLMSMLAGSSEVMEKYGVNVKMAAINQELLANSINPKEASEYQKILARINITMRETAQAQGDAARTQGSLTNQWRAAQNQIQNSLQELGTELLPTVTQAMRDLNMALKEMGPLLKDVAAVSGQMAKELAGRGEVFNRSQEARTNRQLGARGIFGEFGGRLYQAIVGGDVAGALTPTDMLRRRSGRAAQRRINAAQENRRPAATAAPAPAAPPQEQIGGGTGFLGTALGNLAGNAGFRARAFVRGMTRQFGPQIMDARRGLREQIKGMRAVRDAQLRAPKSSHETFSVAAFGGDFTRMSDTVESNQKELLDVTKEMLAFIKENRVVFG